MGAKVPELVRSVPQWGVVGDQVAACFARMKAHLSRMILHSVSAVSFLPMGVPMALA